MSKLGLALIGGSAAMNEFERLENRDTARERAQKRFDWESQRAESELSTLPDKTEATRSGYQLRGQQNNANIGLVNAQTENAAKELALKGAGLDAAKERQPLEQATSRNNAEIAKLISEFGVEDLPRVIAEKRMQGMFSDADAGTTAIAKLSDLIQQGDGAQVIRFMNAMNSAQPAGKRRADVATVGSEQDPTTKENVFVARDAQGKDVMRMSASQMKRIRDSVGKTDLKVINAGDTLVGIKGGQASALYTAPESAKSTAAKQGPLERDVGYLVKQHGMSNEQALAHLNSAKTMTREQFILKSAQDSIALGKKPTSEEVANFGTLYDSARQAPPSAPASNSPAPATLDPQIKSLLGIP